MSLPAHPFAHLASALAADLATLSEGLDRPRDEIEAHLHQLLTTLVDVVPSLLGMSVAVTVDGYDFRFTAAQTKKNPVRTSLRIPLPTTIAAGFDSALVLYATTPGNFVDLAADLAHLLQVELTTLILDAHLTMPEPVGLNGLQDYTTTNHAIGVLLARGDTPQAAQKRLERLGGRRHGNLAAAAAEVLDLIGSADDTREADDLLHAVLKVPSTVHGTSGRVADGRAMLEGWGLGEIIADAQCWPVNWCPMRTGRPQH